MHAAQLMALREIARSMHKSDAWHIISRFRMRWATILSTIFLHFRRRQKAIGNQPPVELDCFGEAERSLNHL